MSNTLPKKHAKIKWLGCRLSRPPAFLYIVKLPSEMAMPDALPWMVFGCFHLTAFLPMHCAGFLYFQITFRVWDVIVLLNCICLITREAGHLFYKLGGKYNIFCEKLFSSIWGFYVLALLLFCKSPHFFFLNWLWFGNMFSESILSLCFCYLNA